MADNSRTTTSCCLRTRDTPKKQKIIYTVCIYYMFTIIGWVRGIFGPSFPDLQRISNVDLERGSWIVTLFFIGYAIGSMASGVVYNKVNRKLMFGACLLVLAVMMAVTPWCFLYWAMVTAHFFQGVTQGVVDTAGNAEVLLMWRDNRMIYFGLDLLYGIGSFLSPLVAAPFLTNDLNNTTHHQLNTSHVHSNGSPVTMTPMSEQITYQYEINSANGSVLDITTSSQIELQELKSLLYIPYSLTACLVLVSAISYISVYCIYDKKLSKPSKDGKTSPTEENVASVPPRKLPKKIKMAALGLMSAILFVFTAFNEAFSSYLTVYCVEYLSWSTTDGAIITSVVNIVGIVSTVIALFLKCLNTMVFAGIHCFALVTSLIGLVISSIHYEEIGVWASVVVFGYFKAVLFSLLYTWTNEYITPVTGKISSLFMLTSMVGSSVNPIMLGYLMEEYTNLWFSYLFLIESILTCILYVMAVLLTQHISSKYGKTYPQYSDSYKDEDISEQFLHE